MATLEEELRLLGEGDRPISRRQVDSGAVELEFHSQRHRLQLRVPKEYPALPLEVAFGLGEGAEAEKSEESRERAHMWQEQMTLIASEAAAHHSSSLQVLLQMLRAADEDVELKPTHPSGAPGLATGSTGVPDDTGCSATPLVHPARSSFESSFELLPPPLVPVEITESRYLHLVPLTHSHGFHICLDDLAMPWKGTLGRLPCCTFQLDHPSCSQKQLEFELESTSRLVARVVSGHPMLLFSQWRCPGDQAELQSSDVLAIPSHERDKSPRDRVAFLAWRLQLSDSPEPLPTVGARLIPLHRPDPEHLLDGVTCLGTGPAYRAWRATLVAEQRDATALVERDEAGILHLRHVGTENCLLNELPLAPGSREALRQGDVISLCRGRKMERGRSAHFVVDLGQEMSRPQPTPCRAAIAEPDSLTMTVPETANLTVLESAWPTQLESAPSLAREEDPEATLILPGIPVHLWLAGEDAPKEEPSSEASSAELMAACLQEPSEPSEPSAPREPNTRDELTPSTEASFFRENSTEEWQGPSSSPNSLARLEHWVNQAEASLKRSREEEADEASEQCPLLRRTRARQLSASSGSD